MKPLNPNSMIQGRYLIVQPIGKGGMGEVYLAVDQRLGSAVALKRTFFSEDSMLGNAFEREARILARLRHPVLPKVIDHFAENGDQFLVMEHISGDDIAKRMEMTNKPFPVSWVMFWADQMLDALSYLHSHEPPIIHRDIKPQNLKLTDDNHIVLLDFGLSKDFDSTASGLNSASVAGYSPHFASMEQIRGTGTDARSDLYSLAATLYQMLANVVPPDALTRADALLGGKKDPILPLNEANPEVPKAISDVILKAVAIRQDERFASASEMQKELRRAFNKEKGAPEPQTAPTPSVVAGAAETRPAPAIAEAGVTAAAQEDPETETRMRTAPPKKFDETVKMERPVASADDVKTSEMKTAVLTTGAAESGPRDEGGQSAPQRAEQPPARAAAAAAAAPAPSSGKKKSGAGLIIGVLAALALLVGVGGAAAWYLTRAGAQPTPGPAANTAPVANVQSTPQSQPPSVETPANSVSEPPAVADVPANSPAGNRTGVTTPKQPPAKTTQAPAAKAPPKDKPKDSGPPILQ
jgi:hypothetical protein